MALSEKIIFWYCWGFCVLFGMLLIDSSLEQAGIGPNFLVRPEAYGTRSLEMMVPMLGIGTACLLAAGLFKLWYNQQKLRLAVVRLIEMRIAELREKLEDET